MKKFQFSILKLFNALLISNDAEKLNKKISKDLTKETIQNGFVFSQDVIDNFSENDLRQLSSFIRNEKLCLSFDDLNKSLHKSWKKVQDSDDLTLIIEQLLHYLTGQNDFLRSEDDYVYIPCEKLKVPKLDKEKIKLTLIKGYTKEQIYQKTIDFINTGIAIKEETLTLIDDIFSGLKISFSLKDIEELKNKELRIILYKKYGLVPNDNIEFLRFLLHVTGNSLLIKNKGTYEKIRTFSDYDYILNCFKTYIEQNSLEKLSEIFLRFKELFLSFKKLDNSNNGELRKIINLLRRKAIKNHKPLKEDFLNSLTKNIDTFSKDELNKELEKVNIFRKIRLLSALKFRTLKNINYIAYNIRNGKSYVQEYYTNKSKNYEKAYDIIYNSIIKDISGNVAGKNILIPDFINYALPTSEKQFLGNVPFGSYVEVDKDIIFGVYWENLKNKNNNDYYSNRIDLDLSLIAMDGVKYGWDANYRSSGRDVLFSGDITDAVNGANEYFYVKNNFESGNNAILLNFFNGSAHLKDFCDYKFIIAKSKESSIKKNYVVDPNKILLSLNDKIKGNEKQKFIGLFESKKNGNRLYIFSSNIGNAITSMNNTTTDGMKEFIANKYKNAIMLKQLLKDCGANVFSEIPKDEDGLEIDIIDLNLSPEVLEKDTIVNLLTSK